MAYEIKAGQTLMRREGLVTILLAYAETPRLFHTRNPFASARLRGSGDGRRYGGLRRLSA